MNEIVSPQNGGTLTVTVAEQWNERIDERTTDVGKKYRVVAVPAAGFEFVRFEWTGRVDDGSGFVPFANNATGTFDQQLGGLVYEAQGAAHDFTEHDLGDRDTVTTWSWGTVEYHHVVDSVTAVFRRSGRTHLILRQGTPGPILRRAGGSILRDD